jgi:hypothetical protein
MIDRSIHPSGLLWSDIRKRSLNTLRHRDRRLALVGAARSYAKARQPSVVFVINDYIFGFDVSMYEAAAVRFAKRRRRSDADAQDVPNVQSPLQDQIERTTAWIFQH